MQRYLIFDVGGTNTRIAVARSARIGKIIVEKTPKRIEDMLQLLENFGAGQGGRFSAIVGCLPGQFDAGRTRLVSAHNLPSWIGKDIGGPLRKRFHCPVVLENDAVLAGLGEAVRGAGKGRPIVAYMTVSTGVNGVRIVDGKIDRPAWGYEIGRQLIAPHRTLESVVGGAALAKRHGRSTEKIQSAKVWKNVHKELARGIFNTLLHWSPDLIVLGGGMVTSGAVRTPDLNRELSGIRQQLRTHVPIPPIVRGALGQSAGLVGAVVLAEQKASFR